MHRGTLMAIAVALVAACPARAQRQIGADAYLDKLRGMWLGQVLGNYAGRASEGRFLDRGGNPATEVPFVFANPSHGDDDTCFEYMYMDLLAAQPDPAGSDMKAKWEAHVPLPSFYIANRQARWLMADGLVPPDTGSIGSNMHWWAIDSQITTEALGAAAPGMRQRAADLAGRFGSVTNDGYAVHAAQFYAAMYAAAAFESDVQSLVALGQAVVPATSRTYEIVQNVRDWYAADAADAGLDWRSTQEKIYDRYVGVDSCGRFHHWVESAVNTALTTMAILYGQGDFKETVRVGVLGGFDSDCNPATAGGLIGLIDGYSGLPADLTAQAADAYYVDTLVGLTKSTTIQQVAAGFQAVAEGQILLAGGSIEGAGAERTYFLPGCDEVAPPPARPDRTGPRGLVGAVRALGGSPAISASVEWPDPADERRDLDAVIDGVTDVSGNGHVAYETEDGANPQPSGGDFFQIDFGRDLLFTSAVFWEGNLIRNGINTNPKDDEPKGGYFLNLSVEVGDDGQFTEAGGLTFSEPLEPFEYYQRIELAFEAIVGDAIRIRGDAGGRWECTSIVELEAFGQVPGVVAGDADQDGQVNYLDLGIVATNYGNADATLLDGDFDLDGTVTYLDLGILATQYGSGAAAPLPEPVTAVLMALGAAAALARRQRPRTARTYREAADNSKD